jgi:hypothetical protein
MQTQPSRGRCNAPLRGGGFCGQPDSKCGLFHPSRANSDATVPDGFGALQVRARRYGLELDLGSLPDNTWNRTVLHQSLRFLDGAVAELAFDTRGSRIRFKGLQCAPHDDVALSNLKHRYETVRAQASGSRQRFTVWRDYRQQRRTLAEALQQGVATISLAEASSHYRRFRRNPAWLRITYHPQTGRLHTAGAVDKPLDNAVTGINTLLLHEITHLADYAALPSHTAKQIERWLAVFRAASGTVFGTSGLSRLPVTQYGKTNQREFVAEVATMLNTPDRYLPVIGAHQMRRLAQFAVTYNEYAGRVVITHDLLSRIV